MKKNRTRRSTGLALGMLATAALVVLPVQAADHQEAPGATAQLSADIGDYYVWHENDQLNLVLTFGTFAAPGLPATYDSNVLYGFHFDTSATPDGVADTSLYARFAQDVDGNWGMQVTGASASALEGPVETILVEGGLTGWAGLADDPFFFDQTGFRETVATGAISFDPTNDDVAGLNVTALVLQFPVDSILSGGGALQTWATTSSL